jgi:hypothetical protein
LRRSQLAQQIGPWSLGLDQKHLLFRPDSCVRQRFDERSHGIRCIKRCAVVEGHAGAQIDLPAFEIGVVLPTRRELTRGFATLIEAYERLKDEMQQRPTFWIGRIERCYRLCELQP